MGFLDKLLGRGKDTAESAGDAAKDVGNKAEEVFDETKSRVTGDDAPSETSEVTQSEQRLDEARDQVVRDEGPQP